MTCGRMWGVSLPISGPSWLCGSRRWTRGSRGVDDKFVGLNQRIDDFRTDMNQRLNDMNQKLTTSMWVVSGWFMFLTAVLAVFGFLRT